AAPFALAGSSLGLVGSSLGLAGSSLGLAAAAAPAENPKGNGFSSSSSPFASAGAGAGAGLATLVAAGIPNDSVPPNLKAVADGPLVAAAAEGAGDALTLECCSVPRWRDDPRSSRRALAAVCPKK